MTLRPTSPRASPSNGPPKILYDRIRASIGTAPASTTSTRTRTVRALAATFLVAAGVLLLASEVVYERQAVGLEVAAQSTPHLLFVLLALVGLTFVSTRVALTRGRSGLGPKALSLALVAGLVAPVSALLVLESPVHAQDPRSRAGYLHGGCGVSSSQPWSARACSRASR